MGRREPTRSRLVSRLLSPALSESAPDLAQRVSAINDVAKTARTLLTSMAAVAVAMAATMIAATDEAIFRDSAKVFPSLSVEIRLSTAFTLAPPVFVFLHLNALLQLHLLTRRLRACLTLLNEGRHDEYSRDAWLRQLHGLSFVQMLLPDRQGGIGRLLQAIASWLSVVALPVLLLLAVQVSFVRYQSWAITIIHMASLGADIALLIWFQLSLWPDFWKRLTALAAPGLLAVVGIMTQAVPPETLRDRWNLFDSFIGQTQGFAWTRRTLSLPGAVLINTDAKPDLLKPLSHDDDTLRRMQAKMLHLSVPNRSFVGIDLRNAELFGINMAGNNLREATLSMAQMQGANLRSAQMQGADLQSAQMQGANLASVQMQEAALQSAQMQGANLESAQMQGADLSSAQMQGANLSSAQMQGGKLWFAQMQGADLSSAQMQGADILSGQMQGANLFSAEMQGASLLNVQMQGASLNYVQMQGADLGLAQMQGVSLDKASMQGGVFIGTDIGGAIGTVSDCTALLVRDLKGGPRPTREDLSQQLAASGISKKVIDTRLEGYGKGPPLRCKDNPDQTLSERAPPSVRVFGEIWRGLSCSDQAIAQRLWIAGLPGYADSLSRVRAILARPPEAGCRKLRDIPTVFRQQMDAFWSSLSPDQKRQAGGG